MLYRRFEQLIDIFREAPSESPPTTVWPFYLYYLRQVWPSFLALLVVGLFASLIEVAMFSYLSRIIDLAQGTPNASFFSEHSGELIWMLVVILLLRPLFFGLHDLLVHQTINPGMTSLIRWQNHTYVLKQSLNFFQSDFAGRIAQRIMQTGNSLRDSAVQAVDALWHVLIYAITSLVLFAEADWRLMLPLLVWIAGYIAALFYFVPRVKERSVISSDARSKLMGRIVDGYTNIATLKLFAHTDYEQQYAREAIREQTEKTQLASRVITSMDVVITTLNGLLVVATTGLALWLWSQSLITVGAIALATGLVIRIVNMSGWIMWVVNGIFENIGMVQDGLQTIAQPVTVTDPPNAPALKVSRGAVHFDDVDFHYGKGANVIEGLDLNIRPGEKIGLIGPSGAGKSTLVNLLLRLYDVQGGRILIDGQNIAEVSQASLRAQIGMITQDTSLLHRSIRDNLLYGRPGASEAELHEAVRRARADEFIPQLSDAQGRTGFDAHVGERGVKLSGGQRQRIAIARVLLKNAPILIMDEATSALDSEVEAAIQESLETLMQGKTVIAIAHRLSTIARMDRLVVLDKGRIVESGSHAQLLEQQGLYARLWHHQTGGFVGVD
ncbi:MULTISPECIES: ABC transporter ATP-binding protein [Pseudomonas]|jgi:ATP-binding cassette subfamily B multidrug efflux pump|uniref:ABC transporter ATP-binding/permease protein n=1 Tax=Pseudomonas putida NBRC 14164 TaxID=1211579 RepID=A0ABM7EBV1_PSEPU|nr:MULTISPECIES: ABC transporter ATP-binding protein [Pseudomonas]EKT4463461.1 ABC transporter ATP-binding protein [Pseudomonas putida]EKT4556843.1 ABC transporter ATP-binding protein [Pseudomonas putida]KWW14875.1 multidrug ABC transporter ATP-binding protein [Pseudomonas putida]MCX9139653.1 ABC transporter ATP-binding protein/permease [Pseudomonas sp. DCB_PUT]MDD1973576.1 ABC transporter ATP-binding protein/permease [Pseudomonas putida]